MVIPSRSVETFHETFDIRRIAPVAMIGAAILLAWLPAAHAQGVSADLTAALHDAARLAPDAPTASVSAQVTDAAGVVFDIVATAPNVGVSLLAPNGVRYTEATIGAIGGAAQRQTFAPGGRTLITPTETPGDHVTFTIPTPFQGLWTIELSAPAAIPARSPLR
jgi:hypothetical protein